MKNALFTLYFMLFCASVFSQNCPTNDVLKLYTQTQVDNFASNYPDCAELYILRIQSVDSGDVITNLDALSQLTSIIHTLQIEGCPDLVNLNGLQNITGNIDFLHIESNDALESLSGLEGLISAINVHIERNHALSNLEGLNNLVSVVGASSNGISITNNRELLNFEGLDNLSHVSNLYITQNNDLINFDGLENLNTLLGIRIWFNRSLTSLTGLEGVDSMKRVVIYNNDALTNLTGLDNLVDVEFNLELENNDALTHLNALSNLSSVHDILIKFNPALSNLQGLEQLTTAPSGINVFIQQNAILEDISALGNAVLWGVDIRYNPELMSLIGLENSTNLNRLSIVGNDKLMNLAGLENLTTAEQVSINDNDNIVSLAGLENLTHVQGGLSLSDNQNLTDISVLSNLTSVRSIFIYNTVLSSLAGLENVSTLNENPYNSSNFTIANNPLLSDISALNIFPYYGNIDNLNMYNNPNLPMCSQQGICYYLASGRPFDIYGNLTNCNSDEEILSTCIITDYPCPQEDVMLTSQAQVDSFAIRYPNCMRIYGSLTISSDSITNVDALSQIRTIDSDLNICNNPLLADINVLSSTMNIGGDFWLKNNDAILFVGNTFLLNGGDIFIEGNDALEDIVGIANYIVDVNYLNITDNPNLSSCTTSLFFPNGETICAYLQNGGSNDIYNNTPGCNSANEIVDNCPTLPITLTDFQAKIENKTTLLTWQTATETNNAGFEIQRSTDAVNWEKIAWQDGQGTTTSAHTYTHRDENPLFGTSYYRLKQVDFDGAFAYTDIAEVYYEKGAINIYPNPVENTLYIGNVADGDIQHISIYDQTGRGIYLQRNASNTINVSALSPGMYIVKVGVGDGVFCEKFIVN